MGTTDADVMLLFAALLLYYAVSRYLPTHVRIIAQRARYYLSGSHSPSASVPDAKAPWSIVP